MQKKYRHILAGIAIIGAIAAVWFWGFHRPPTLHSCIVGYLTALGIMSARALLKAYLQHDRQMKCRPGKIQKRQEKC